MKVAIIRWILVSISIISFGSFLVLMVLRLARVSIVFPSEIQKIQNYLSLGILFGFGVLVVYSTTYSIKHFFWALVLAIVAIVAIIVGFLNQERYELAIFATLLFIAGCLFEIFYRRNLKNNKLNS